MTIPQEFDYKRYLASREWAVLKQQVRLRAALGVPGWADTAFCERCLLRPMYAVHHMTYERAGHEDLEDLVGLCRGCHAFLSAKSAEDPVDEALAAQVKELAWAAKELQLTVESKDWSDYHPTGCLCVATSAIERIEKIQSRRAAISAGVPASRFLR